MLKIFFIVETIQLLAAGMLTLRDPPWTPNNSTQKRSSSTDTKDAGTRDEE